ncbi:MAG: hypothetical protein J1E33_03710 [Alistipes sp.]|nr:hypothetical protein [Alistipes sp.]
MIIYSPLHTAIYDAPITTAAIIKNVLMGDYYIELPFNTREQILFSRGSYILYKGYKFKIKDEVNPDFDSATGGWKYTLRFWARQSDMKDVRVKWTKATPAELIFNDTTDLRSFGNIIAESMNAFEGTQDWAIGNIPEEYAEMTKLVSFQGDKCWDGLTTIADTFGVEWWTEENGNNIWIHFGKLELGTAEVFKRGDVITSLPAKKGDDAEYGTRFFVFGSTRNLPDDYDSTGQEGITNHVSQKRLHLPAGYKFIDARENLTKDEIVEQIVIFDDVFPKNTETVTGIETIPRLFEGGDSSKQETFEAYVMKCADTPFLPSDVIEGETLQAQFTSGSLMGRTFDLAIIDDKNNPIDPATWKPTDGFNKKFEIIHQEEDSGSDKPLIIPNASLHPKDGDTFVLIGVRLPAARKDAAEQELLKVGLSYAKEHSTDTTVYDCPTNPVYCTENDKNYDLGQRVLLDDERFGPDGRTSRIQAYEKKLYNEYIATYTVGDNTAYSRFGTIEKDVKAAAYSERFGVSTTTGGVYLIRSQYDSTPASDTNAYSALASDKRFLNRLAGGTVNGKTTFEKGLQVGRDFSAGITGVGGNIDENGNAELESLALRRFLEVPELRYNRVDITLGNTWRAVSAGIIESVIPDTDAEGSQLNSGIIHLKLESGEIGSIAENDICMGIYHNEANPEANSTKDSDDGKGNFTFAGFSTVYFRITEVLDKGVNASFRYALRPISETWKYSHQPQEAMHFVGYGNFTNPERQTSQYSTRSYERYLREVNDWEFSGRNIGAQFGDLSNLALFGIDMAGYSAYLNNIYMTGRIQQMNPQGQEVPVITDKGVWSASETCYKNDDVYHNNAKWRCLVDGTTSAPSKSNSAWLLLEEAVQGAAGSSVTITSTSVMYQKNTSGTTAPTGTWLEQIPATTAGEYLWTRTIVSYSDGKSTTSYSVAAHGATGAAGKDGTNGKDGTSVTITSHSVTYAVTNSEAQPADSAFISDKVPSISVGQYLWSKTEVKYSDGTIMKSYSVSRVGADGADGVAGATGADGKTSYFHTAYANSADGKTGFSTTYFSGALYIGTCSDFNQADPTTASSYEWARLKGDTGDAARSYILESSTLAMKRGYDNALTPATVTFSSFYRDGNSAVRTAYAGRMIIAESTDGNTFTNKYTSSANESSKVYTPSAANVTAVRCTLYAAGGTTTMLDVQTTVILKDIEGLEVGVRNLALNSKTAITNQGGESYRRAHFPISIQVSAEDIFTVRVDKITNIQGTPDQYSVIIYDKSISTALNDKINITEGKEAQIKLKSGIDTQSGVLLVYAGISGNTAGNTVQFDNVMLVKGNKMPTTWTPAPEDVQADIDAAQSAADSAQKTADSLKDFTDTAFADGIIDRAEAVAIEKYKNSVNETKKAVDASYSAVYNNTLLSGTPKSNLQAAKSAFDTAVANLLASVATASDDGIATAAEKADVDAKYATFNDAYSTYTTRLEEAQAAIETAINTTAQGAYQLSEQIRQTLDNLTTVIIPDLQDQIDGQIVSWTGDAVPTLNNYPASDWKTDTEKKRHENDYYDRKVTASDGTVSYERYKFTKSGNTYTWERISDSGAAQALAEAREALGIAGSKVKLFYGDSTPSVPYSVNDIWIKTDGSIYICNADRATGSTAATADWMLVNDSQARLRQMSSDSVISREEKAVLRNRLAQIENEFAQYQSDATKYGISITALTTAKNNLVNFLTGTVAVNNDTDTTLTTAQRTSYNTYFANYDAEVSRFGNLVADKLAEEATSLIVTLSNEYQGIPSNASGVIANFPACSTTVNVFYGTTDVSAEATYSATPSGLTGTWNATTRTYTVTALSADTGYVDIKATYKGLTTTKRFNVAKTKAGADGRGIASSVVTYQAGKSGTIAPTGTWLSSPPATEAGYYLWTRTVIQYTDNTSDTLYSVSAHGATGAPGKDGAAGRGISKITEYYLASASGSGVTTSTSGWTTDVQTMDATKPYLWNYEVTSFTDGDKSTTTPVIIGRYGKDGGTGAAGRGIAQIINYYAVTTTPTAPSVPAASSAPSSPWQIAPPAMSATNKYLWNYERMQYTSGTNWEATTPHIVAVYGDTGAPGKDGANGKDGADAVRYWLAPSATTIGQYANGTPKILDIDVDVMAQVGNELPYIDYSLTINWRIYNKSYDSIASGSGKSTLNIPLDDYINLDRIEIYVRKDGAWLDSIIIPAIDDGEKGLNGCILRTSQWAANVEFRNDTEVDTTDVRYLDVVVINDDNGNQYRFQATAAHNGVRSSNANKPPYDLKGNTYWSPLSSMAPLYTPLLLADNAEITFLQGMRLLIKNDAGSIIGGFIGDSTPLFIGATYANRANAPFRVSQDGSFVATKARLESAYVSGELHSEKGNIGGFTIGKTDLVSTSDLSKYSMSLSADGLRFTEGTRKVSLGVNTLPSSFASAQAPFRIDFTDTESSTSGHIGLYLSISGARSSDTNGSQYYGNHALYISQGDICGFRLRTRRVSSSQTLSLMDSIIIGTNTSAITLTLPANAEDGQLYFIRAGSANITVSAPSGQYIHKKSNVSSVSLGIYDLFMVIFDETYKVWRSNYMSSYN